MSTPIPTQIRTVDPFASYDSNTVNKLTRMVTYGNDGLANVKSCNLTLDATSVTVINMLPGIIYKDDMWIDITASHLVDFTDPDHYFNFDSGFDEAGYYYVVCNYTYAKQRPAPQAEILIVKPSQRAMYSPNGIWVFLKAVHVSWNGATFAIDGVSDFDLDYPNNKRTYIPDYAGGETTLPSFDQTRDVSRMIYVKDEDDFFFGLSDKWSDGLSTFAGPAILKYNTTGFDVGELVYVTPANNLAKANSSIQQTTADGAVYVEGIDGRIITNGRISYTKVELGRTIHVGSLLYLSQSDPGRVTDVKTTPFHQFVGRCTKVLSSNLIEMLFIRGEPGGDGSSEFSAYTTASLIPPNWLSSGILYYQDVDISTLSGMSGVITCWDATSEMKIEPESIEFIDSNTLRIWMINDIESINVLVVGPAATPISATNTITIHESLLVGNWLGAGPYYQDVDVSDIIIQSSVLMVRDTVTDEVIYPSNIEFDSTSNLRIWMPVNTEDLEVTVVGPTNLDETVYALTNVLASGASWIFDSGLYFQDISLAAFGGDNEVIFEFISDTSGKVVKPTVIEFVDSITARIWMPNNTTQLNVTILG